MFGWEDSNQSKGHHPSKVRNTEQTMQVRQRARMNESRDRLTAAPSLDHGNAVRCDAIPIQQRKRDPEFVRAKPRTAVAVTGIKGLYAAGFVDLWRKPCAARNFFIAIHRHSVRVVPRDDRPECTYARTASCRKRLQAFVSTGRLFWDPCSQATAQTAVRPSAATAGISEGRMFVQV